MTVRTVAPDSPRLRLTPRAGFLLIALALLALFAVGPAREYMSVRGHIAELERKAEGLERANTALHREIDRLHDPAEKERLARECLGMVGPGEIAFVIGPRAGTAEPTPC
jgi:cell division protein FtsB